MIAFFDTETSGLPQKRPSSLDLEPHVLQLAVSLYDNERRPVFELSTLVRLPDGVSIDAQADATHSISAISTLQYGVGKLQAVKLLEFAFARAEVVVAHNLQFDRKLIDFETRRLGIPSLFENRRTFCTMEATTDLLRIPPTPAMVKWGHGDKFKNPKLAEAYKFFFNEDLVGAHDALIDTRACARVYFELKDRKLL